MYFQIKASYFGGALAGQRFVFGPEGRSSFFNMLRILLVIGNPIFCITVAAWSGIPLWDLVLMLNPGPFVCGVGLGDRACYESHLPFNHKNENLHP